MNPAQDIRRAASIRLVEPWAGRSADDRPDPAPRSRISICADDFAHSHGTSEVIVNLAHARRINAIGCMTVRQGWHNDARLLAGLPQDCEIGLHLVLTDGQPLTAMPLYAPAGAMPSAAELYRRPISGDLLNEISIEVARQFHAFWNVFDRAPDFVASHDHVHLFPRIREIVLEESAWRAPDAWLRSCSDMPRALLARAHRGRALRSAWHSRGYAKLARSFGVSTNSSFAGHYDFSEGFADVFPRFFDQAGDHHVIMVHPGADDCADDPIAQARAREAAFLASYRPPCMAGAALPAPAAQ